MGLMAGNNKGFKCLVILRIKLRCPVIWLLILEYFG
ncbi:hypothetical protein SLEP1_g14369 [Rubroshorea leprosula]|uniref:Uncharacterized protein n=1 Tax=Rubroshorea leprosula TaxID=152421 RepID=A0AAV5IVD2_9ROSI|nr:hypothetical protein SLEP1_g14369 [Rubroshorea leprosula]